MTDATSAVNELQSKLENEREAHAKTRAELYDLRAEYMSNLNNWEDERLRLEKQRDRLRLRLLVTRAERLSALLMLSIQEKSLKLNDVEYLLWSKRWLARACLVSQVANAARQQLEATR